MPHFIELNHHAIACWCRLRIVIFCKRSHPNERRVNVDFKKFGNGSDEYPCAYIKTARSFSCLLHPLFRVGVNWQTHFLHLQLCSPFTKPAFTYSFDYHFLHLYMDIPLFSYCTTRNYWSPFFKCLKNNGEICHIDAKGRSFQKK